MAIGEKLSQLLESKKIKPGTLARLTNIPKGTIYSIIQRNNKNVDFSTMETIASFLEVPVEFFYDKQPNASDSIFSIPGIEPIPEMRKVPIVGDIACGMPITAVENIEDYINVPVDVSCDFILRCKGDSMEPRLMDGDLVFIRTQPDVEDGQIAAVLHDGEATLKHVYHLPRNSGIQLVSDNTAYQPMLFTAENSDDLRILGLAVAYQRRLLK